MRGQPGAEEVDARLRVVGHAQTGQLVVMSEGGDRPGATLLIPGANSALDGRTALVDTDPDDVVLVRLDVPASVVAQVLREADRRQLRVVVDASPYATVDPEVAAPADPFGVGAGRRPARRCRRSCFGRCA